MGETLKDRLFREPEGKSQGLLWISFALLFFTIYLYYSGLNDDRASIGLALGVLFVGLSIPELLPSDQRYLAGLLRVAVMGGAVIAFLLGILSF